MYSSHATHCVVSVAGRLDKSDEGRAANEINQVQADKLCSFNFSTPFEAILISSGRQQ
jgi:hypothetical protein